MRPAVRAVVVAGLAFAALLTLAPYTAHRTIDIPTTSSNLFDRWGGQTATRPTTQSIDCSNSLAAGPCGTIGHGRLTIAALLTGVSIGGFLLERRRLRS